MQKYIRKHDRQFVGVSCHYDIVDWLQPDWIFEPHTMTFTRRCLQRRPALDVTISPVSYSAWHTFAPFHYLTKELNRSAQCYVLFVGDRMASFVGIINRPHSKVNDIMGRSRSVTLPDWQGLGLAFVLSDTIGSAYTALGYRFHSYPAHPAYIRAHDRSKNWVVVKRPGIFSTLGGMDRSDRTANAFGGGRPNAVFRYVGDTMEFDEARRLTGKIPYRTALHAEAADE